MLRIAIISPFARRVHVKEELLLQECRNKLKVSEHCTATELREAFLNLARKYHPDSGSADACAKKFTDIENAYRTLSAKLAINKEEETDEDENPFKYIAPQHRQYLNFEGIGSGTPSQRQRQYQSYRLHRAASEVAEHKIRQLGFQEENALLAKDKVAARKHRISNAIDRLVEDLIQESMSKGEFTNLPGQGKPLNNSNFNPFIDGTTHKLNQVLINNGYTPDWVILRKEINQILNNLREQLEIQRRQLGPWPIGSEDQKIWDRILKQFEGSFKDLNLQIDKYNLVVPFLYKQMAHFQLKRESERILRMAPTTKGESNNKPTESPQGLMEFIDSVLGKLK